MIHFMPFTHLHGERIQRLADGLGRLTVLQPLASLVPSAMHQAAAQERLHLQPCPRIDERQLTQSLKGFADWAALHRNDGEPLAGIYHFQAARAADALEESPNRIRTRLQRAAAAKADEAADPLLQAALFLCLAHRFDEQQDALQNDMGAVRAMEDRLERLLGEAPDDSSSADALSQGAAGQSAMADLGAHMTERRVQAWARLALGSNALGHLYVTDSMAVWQHLLEMLPEAQPVGNEPLGGGADGSATDAGATALQQHLHRLAAGGDFAPDEDEKAAGAAVGAGSGRLTLRRLQACTPATLLTRLCKQPAAAQDVSPDTVQPPNVLIGLVET
ncbi:hypothetical protein [Desulfatitalea alkaliphila]|uniref:Uncharacterized protein n=1 Tax=Desulfatitalea alkaliphila TaxID=2929485 RepID=A0AA41UK84_9BACT|nr:hypothetical protein [Desulfatitalea alkaliphila]MCJ8502770.1 hypothetical protein [Desulfatitalea alkaliphila]